MRVALIGPTHPYKGGIAQHTTMLARRLSEAGNEVDLVSWSAQYPSLLYPGQQKTEQPEAEPFPRTSYPLSWARPAGWWREGRRLKAYDAVVLVVVTPVQAPAYLSIIAAASRGRGRRPTVVALCHNVLPHEPRPGDRRLTAAVLARADAVLVHSEAEANVARGLTRTPVVVGDLPPHLPATRRNPPPDLSETRRTLLFFGIVRPYKGLDVLLRALARVPDVSLTVAGEFWNGRRSADELVRSLGIADRVRLLAGYVPDSEIPKLFAEADALVLPYRSGTATQNVWLAFEHGLPVIATRVGTLDRLVTHEVNGLVVPPDDDAALAGALGRLYEPGTLARLRSGITAVEATSGWTSYLDALNTAWSIRRGGAMTAAAPPGGPVLDLAKRAAERALWARVTVQTAIERRAPGGRPRPVCTGVGPTAILRRRSDWEAAVAEARRLRLPLHPDRPKNWDALGAVGAVVSRVGRNARVLDAGSARYSPVLPWLRLYGLTDLVGVNIEFGDEVRRGSVKFQYGDITATGFPDASFDAITCMSVIEHGVPVARFLAESARLLRSGGVLSLSTDYDQQPPDTTGRHMYGVPVRIFGPDDIRELVTHAEKKGLRLVGELRLSHEERPVHWKRMDLDYTFILLTFLRD